MRSVAGTSHSLTETSEASLADQVSRSSWLLLGGMLLLAFLIRLLFISAAGYTGDVSTFEAWALALGQHPPSDFYSSTGFADYPPGYF